MSWGSRTALLVTLALVAVGCGTSESRRDAEARGNLQPRLTELIESAESALIQHQDAEDVVAQFTHREVLETIVVGDVVTWTVALTTQAQDPRSWGNSVDIVGSCVQVRGHAGDGGSLQVVSVECSPMLLRRSSVALDVEIDLLED